MPVTAPRFLREGIGVSFPAEVTTLGGKKWPAPKKPFGPSPTPTLQTGKLTSSEEKATWSERRPGVSRPPSASFSPSERPQQNVGVVALHPGSGSFAPLPEHPLYAGPHPCFSLPALLTIQDTCVCFLAKWLSNENVSSLWAGSRHFYAPPSRVCLAQRLPCKYVWNKLSLNGEMADHIRL